jgi:hypothetical protein
MNPTVTLTLCNSLSRAARKRAASLLADPTPGAAAAAEPDAFFSFVDLMGSFRDHFCQQLDNSDAGIKASLSRLSSLLRAHDRPLWEHLEGSNKVVPQFYAFRWVTTLLTQEFAFPDAVRVWDSLLGDAAGREDCLQRLCVAMVLLVREEVGVRSCACFWGRCSGLERAMGSCCLFGAWSCGGEP